MDPELWGELDLGGGEYAARFVSALHDLSEIVSDIQVPEYLEDTRDALMWIAEHEDELLDADMVQLTAAIMIAHFVAHPEISIEEVYGRLAQMALPLATAFAMGVRHGSRA